MPGGGGSERPVWRAVLPALFVVGAGEWARGGGVFGLRGAVLGCCSVSDSGRMDRAVGGGGRKDGVLGGSSSCDGAATPQGGRSWERPGVDPEDEQQSNPLAILASESLTSSSLASDPAAKQLDPLGRRGVLRHEDLLGVPTLTRWTQRECEAESQLANGLAAAVMNGIMQTPAIEVRG